MILKLGNSELTLFPGLQNTKLRIYEKCKNLNLKYST